MSKVTIMDIQALICAAYGECIKKGVKKKEVWDILIDHVAKKTLQPVQNLLPTRVQASIPTEILTRVQASIPTEIDSNEIGV